MGSPPRVYLVHGEDEFTTGQFLHEMQSRLGDKTTASLNTTRLDGKSLALNELRATIATMPFLAARRLVILENPLAALGSVTSRQEFLNLLDEVPETTALVLVVPQNLEVGRPINQPHWLLGWANQAGGRAYVRAFPRMKDRAMSSWIQEQARAAGGSFTPEASAGLAQLVGDDSGLAFQEVHKLLAYAGYQRPVTEQDVQFVFPGQGAMDDFELVNAIRDRDGPRAVKALHRRLELDDPVFILAGIMSQFRMLLLARIILDENGSLQEVIRELPGVIGVRPFPARLAGQSARHFTLPDLEVIYRRLLDLDEAVKTGQVESETALQSFVAAATQR